MYTVMIIVSILFVIDCVCLTAIVLMQQGKAAGLSGAISGAAETYFGKNKARTMEGKLEKWTKILAVIFFVLAFVLYLMVGAMS
jgi:preprotein translocase subunit SecG